MPKKAKAVSRAQDSIATAVRHIRARWSAAERAWRRQVALSRLDLLLRQVEQSWTAVEAK